MRPWSITARLTLYFSATSAAVLLVFGHVVGTLVASHFEMQDLDELTGKLQLVRHALSKANATGDLAAMKRELPDALIGHQGLSILVLGPDLGPLFASGEAAFPPSLIDRATPGDGAWRPAPLVWEHAGHLYRGIVASAGSTLDAAVQDVPPRGFGIAGGRGGRSQAKVWLAQAAESEAGPASEPWIAIPEINDPWRRGEAATRTSAATAESGESRA